MRALFAVLLLRTSSAFSMTLNIKKPSIRLSRDIGKYHVLRDQNSTSTTHSSFTLRFS